MISINYEVLGAILGVLSAPQDEELDERLNKLDGNDEMEVRAIIREVLTPYFNRFDNKSRTVIRETLQYALTVNDAPLAELFDWKQLSFEPPKKSAKLFYLWLWDELFSQKFTPVDVRKYQITDDMDVVYQLRIENSGK